MLDATVGAGKRLWDIEASASRLQTADHFTTGILHMVHFPERLTTPASCNLGQRAPHTVITSGNEYRPFRNGGRDQFTVVIGPALSKQAFRVHLAARTVSLDPNVQDLLKLFDRRMCFPKPLHFVR